MKSNKDIEKLYEAKRCRRSYCSRCGHTIQYELKSKKICSFCGIANYENNYEGHKEYFKDQFKRTLYLLNREEIENGKLINTIR